MARTPNPRPFKVQQLQVVQRTESDVLTLLRQTRLDINKQLRKIDAKDTLSSKVRRQQIMLIKKTVAKEQASLWRSIGDLVRARRLDAAARVIALSTDFDKYMFEALGKFKVPKSTIDSLIKAEEQAAKSSLDRMMQRVYGPSFRTLSERVYTSSINIGSVLDNKINSALARGLSAKEFAKELEPYINPDTPGGLRYASMRLARSEINNAAHALSVSMAQGKPWLESMQWELSASHPKPDVCDDIAEGGTNGDGIYLTSQVPGKPHPQCFCTITPVSVSDQQFLLSLASGGYDDYAIAQGYLKAA